MLKILIVYNILRHCKILGRNYTIRKYIEIDGNKATVYNSSSDDGTTTKSVNNGIIAYILNSSQGYGSSDNYTSAQKQLWHYVNDWLRDLGIDFLVWDRNDNISDTNKDAEFYADTLYDDDDKTTSLKVEDKTTKSKLKMEDVTDKYKTPEDDDNTYYTQIGPFKWKFQGELLDEDGIEVKINHLDSIDEGMETLQSPIFLQYDNNGDLNQLSISSNLKSNRSFYIVVKKYFANIKKVELSLKTEVDTQPLTTDKKYTAKIWLLTSPGWQNLLHIVPGSEDININEKQNGQGKGEYTFDSIGLEIKKIDKRTRKEMKGVGFIFYYTYKDKNENTQIYYLKENRTWSNKRDDAYEWKTDKDGKITIDDIMDPNHTVYAKETSIPSRYYGYELNTDPMEVTLINKNNGESLLNPNEAENIKENEQKYIKLSGYVWNDIQSSKQTVRNDYYSTDDTPNGYQDDQDQGLNGVNVYLKDKDGNIIKYKDENNIEHDFKATTGEYGIYSEIEGGEYRFENVPISALDGAYVEFEYNGMIYKAVTPDIEKDTGSKASETTRHNLDNTFENGVNGNGTQSISVNNKVNDVDKSINVNYNNIDKNKSTIANYSGDTAVCATTGQAGYILWGSKYDDEMINEIRYINLGLYEKPQADLSLTQDLENVKVGVNGYWHTYNYASRNYNKDAHLDGFPDYNANDESTWNVGVKFKNTFTGTYKRAIYESDYNYQAGNIDDTNRLKVYLTYKIGLTNESSYTTQVNSIVDYFDTRYNLKGVGIEPEGIEERKPDDDTVKNKNKVEYKKVTINGLGNYLTLGKGETKYIYVQFELSDKAKLEIINKRETLSNIAEINSYTIFENGQPVAAVDKDSVPGNAKPGETDTYEDDTDAAPSIQLEISGARKITGTVFVDNTTPELSTENIRQGNGEFNNGDATIGNVEVKLVDKDGNIIQTAHTDTGETKNENKGNFEISGFIPGEYTIVYTWGNEGYSVKEYKGTKYDLDRLQDGNTWYRKNVDTRKTDAIDNYSTRIEIDNGEEIATMDSTTPTMKFGVEIDDFDLDNISEGDAVVFEVKNVDFGIVERARQQLDMEKRVSSFKITLANGQVIADVTVGEDGKLNGNNKYVTYMQPSTLNEISSNGFIRAEIDNELIEGAKLEVTYEIKFTNNSELDYMTEDYYKYGILGDDSNVVKLIPSAVVDYLDKNLGFEQSENTDWEKIESNDERISTAKRIQNQGQEQEKDFLNSRMILYTDKTANEIIPGESSSVKLNVSKLLTTSSDLTFKNDAETVKIDKSGNNTQHRGSTIKDYPSDDAEKVIITPSTGDDKNYVLPIVIGMTTLVVLGVGIILIKKFVIDKK